ncbi:MAG: hypothetical protein GY793_07105 [Proteobacteria bacterium]|nr:hypothetical protein [Pseudomonadota bacterium]
MKVTQEELNEFWQNVEAILATECPDVKRIMPYYRENYQPIEGQDFSVLAKIVSDIVQYDLKTLKRMMCMVHMNDDKNLEDFFILIEQHLFVRELFDFEIEVFAGILNYDFTSFIEMVHESDDYEDADFKKYATQDEYLFYGYVYNDLTEYIKNPISHSSRYSFHRNVTHHGHEDEGIKDGDTFFMLKFMKNVSDPIEEENRRLTELAESSA